MEYLIHFVTLGDAIISAYTTNKAYSFKRAFLDFTYLASHISAVNNQY